ncbi:MAG: tyrosine--tRNA ligase [Deltaproteobacteria bacterium]|nr:MAG: tyrosine--tRNA ligase [Deltaproteobacteria bacterium]
MATDIFEELKARGVIETSTDEEALRDLLASGPQAIYVGFDPTADSLHVGHLLPVLMLARLQQSGHRPVALVGGATGMVGDPSGRSSERQLLTPEVVAANAEAIGAQLGRVIRFEGEGAAQLVNNADWITPITFLEWLRDVGKHFSVNTMLAKESVRARLEQREQGISYTEFSYMLLQAYDFLHLCVHHGCRIQAGGNDQWGNITAGIELIRRKGEGPAAGFTFPLVTTASGEKFGKSAGNAVWLDASRTSPYTFYQFWVRTDDRDVEKFLKFFTFLSLEEIGAVVAEHGEAPHRRLAQKRLAEEVTRLVHGESGLRTAEQATAVLFGQEIADLDDAQLSEIFADVPSTELPRARLESGELTLVDLLAETGLMKSRGEARRRIEAGGTYINNVRWASVDAAVGPAQLASESTMVLRAGKKNYHLVRFT